MSGYPIGPADVVRFWSNVITLTEIDSCWLWRGGFGGNGYGCFSLKGKPLIASRVAYQLAYGAIPNGLQIRHSCDNPPCCNPWHLSTGTPMDNAMDRNLRGRNNRGTDMWTAQMTEADVLRIRAAPRSEWKAIAEELGRPLVTVYSAGVGRSWKHLPGAHPRKAQLPQRHRQKMPLSDHCYKCGALKGPNHRYQATGPCLQVTSKASP